MAVGCLALLSGLLGCPNTPHNSGSTAASAGTEDTGGTDGDGAEFFLEHRTYFIGETTKFDGSGLCSNTNLNAVTSTLRKRLDNANWSGLRFKNQNTWPEDFREATKDPDGAGPEVAGSDDLYGDAVRLSIYAGHGGPNSLQWGSPSPAGTCDATISKDSRFGKFGGDRATAVMFMTSCTLETSQLEPTLKNNASRQFFGYHDSPYIGFDEPRQVFKRTQDGQSTGNAWLDEMEDNGEAGLNSPVVVTYADTYAEAQQWFDEANLATGAGYSQNVEDPPQHFYMEWLDNGCGCGLCGDAQLPNIALANAPRLQAKRPVRTSARLAGRVSALATLLGAQPGPTFWMGGTAWADEILSANDIVFSSLPGDPRIEVTYDPAIDQLTIVNHDALTRARPLGPEDLAAPVDDQAALAEAQSLHLAISAILENDAPEPLAHESTRKAGFGALDEPQQAPIAFEYLFGSQRRIAGLSIAGAKVRIGVTRLGEPSRITVTELDIDIIDPTMIVHAPDQVLADYLDQLEAQHPGAIAATAVYTDVGYALAEDQTLALLEPSLLVETVLAFPGGMSRRTPVAISLTTPVPEPKPLAAIGPDDDGDPRP